MTSMTTEGHRPGAKMTMTTREVCEAFGISRHCLRLWRIATPPKFPPPLPQHAGMWSREVVERVLRGEWQNGGWVGEDEPAPAKGKAAAKGCACRASRPKGRRRK
jgi:hypothetical protein